MLDGPLADLSGLRVAQPGASATVIVARFARAQGVRGKTHVRGQAAPLTRPAPTKPPRHRGNEFRWRVVHREDQGYAPISPFLARRSWVDRKVAIKSTRTTSRRRGICIRHDRNVLFRPISSFERPPALSWRWSARTAPERQRSQSFWPRCTRPTAGRIDVDGEDLARLPAKEGRQRLAGAFQDFHRFEFRARESVGVGDVPRMDDRAAVSTAVARAGADESQRCLRGG